MAAVVGGPGQAIGPATESVRHQVLLHRRLGDGEALVAEEIGVAPASEGRLEHREGEQGLDHVGGRGVGHLGCPPFFRHERIEAVALGAMLPLVVAGPGDAEDPTGLRNVAGVPGMFQHGDAAAVDDLGWGHGDGLLGSVMGTTESIAGPHRTVDVQPQLMDRKD